MTDPPRPSATPASSGAVPDLRRRLRRSEERLPRRVRRALRLSRDAELRSQPLVTVVVAARTGRSPGLDACLLSLRRQAHRNLEVLVVLDDHAGAEADLVRRHAAEDWRVGLVARTAARVPAGRDVGAAEAGGAYLTFVRSEDTLPATALAVLVETLEHTGSDFAFGQVAEEVVHRSVTPLVHPAHERTRLAVSLQDLPVAITDTSDENRLYRTDFWRGAGLTFPASAGAGPAPALQAFARARAFDVLAETTYRRSRRGAGRPFGSLVSAMADLDGWLAHQAAVRDLFVESTGSADARSRAAVHQAWATALCDAEVVPLLEDTERASAEQWERLRTFLTSVRSGMTEESWARVRAESRVQVWLAVEGHREVLAHFVVQRLFEVGNRRTTVRDGRVLARFEGLEALTGQGVDLPDHVVEMTERETALHVHLHAARWIDGHRLELRVFAFADFVGYERVSRDSPGDSPGDGPGDRRRHPGHELSAYLVDAASGRRVPLPVEPYVDVEARVVAGHRYQDYAPGAARVVVDATALDQVGVEDALWTFAFVLTLRGLSRTGTITSREERGSAGLLGDSAHAPRVVRLPGGGLATAALRADAYRTVAVHVAAAPEIVALALTAADRTVTGALVAPAGRDGLRGTVVAVPVGGGEHRVESVLRGQVDGTAAFELDLAGRTGPAAWSLRVAVDGRELPVWFPEGVTGPLAAPTPGPMPPGVLAVRSAAGHVEVWESGPLLLESLELGPGELVLRGRWLGAPPPRWRATLRGSRATVTATGTGVADEPAVTAHVPLVWDEWGLGESVVPVGPYQVEITAGPEHAPEREVRVVLGERVVAALASSRSGADVRMTPVRNARGLAVRLAPPLADDERGPYAQRLLQEWSASDAVGTDPRAVYLQSYTGTSATDSPRAVHDELRRSRPDLTPYWAVSSWSTAVPEGGVPVLLHSREWHRVLGSATWLVNNIDFDRWFRRKPHQRYLQTFHGYPSKSMGIRFWRAKHFTPERIRLELGRTSRDWTLILTPAPETDRYYRVEYAYDGDIENTGYPRDDALLAPDAEQVRARTRRLLGIAPDQTAVLYAPTWRDDKATGYRSAELVRHLDVESASAALGEEFVLLARGHRFHARADRRERSARLVDVTDYPEVNDLILASDAAVLDYSSLRFDFALTGRPMIFLVPDLATYTGGVRGFLHPFEESAPGPLLEDAEQVVAALRDLPRLSEQYAAAYARFNATFNHQQDGHAAQRVVRRFFG